MKAISNTINPDQTAPMLGGQADVSVSENHVRSLSLHSHFVTWKLWKKASKNSFLYCYNGTQKHEGFVGFEKACSRANTYVILTSLNNVHFYAPYCWWHQFCDGLQCVYVKYKCRASTAREWLLIAWDTACCAIITLYTQMNSSFWFDSVNLGESIVFIKGSKVWFANKIVFLPLQIVFVFANSVDYDEMPYYAVFHLGLHCLSKYSCSSCQYTKG